MTTVPLKHEREQLAGVVAPSLQEEGTLFKASEGTVAAVWLADGEVATAASLSPTPATPVVGAPVPVCRTRPAASALTVTRVAAATIPGASPTIRAPAARVAPSVWRAAAAVTAAAATPPVAGLSAAVGVPASSSAA